MSQSSPNRRAAPNPGAPTGLARQLHSRGSGYSYRRPRLAAAALRLSGLLECVCESDQPRLAPRWSHEAEPDGKTRDTASRNGYRRVSRHRARTRCPEHVMIAEHIIGQPRRAAGQGDDSIKLVPAQRAVQGSARQAPCLASRGEPLRVGRAAALRRCLFEPLLAEMEKHLAAVLGVERDQLGQARRVVPAEPAEVGIQLVLELMQQRSVLWVADLVNIR